MFTGLLTGFLDGSVGSPARQAVLSGRAVSRAMGRLVFSVVGGRSAAVSSPPMSRLVVSVLLACTVVIQPVRQAVASGLSSLSEPESDRSRSAIPDESSEDRSEERFEESQKERDGESDCGAFLPTRSACRRPLEADRECCPDRVRIACHSTSLADSIRGPPLP